MKNLHFLGDFFDRIFSSAAARDRVMLGVLAVGIALNLSMWGLIVRHWDVLVQPERAYIILHYKANFGPDFYSEWYSIFLIPLTGALFLILNGVFARKVYLHIRAVSYALVLTATVCQFFLALATYLIIQINIF